MTTDESARAVLTGLDESYTHQLVAPRSVTAHHSARWQERTYYLLFTDEGLMLNLGRSVWPHERARKGFAGLTDGVTQAVVRAQEEFAVGEDADAPGVGDVSVTVEEPLRSTRLRAQVDSRLAVDLTWTARFEPVATQPQRVEQHGEVVTDYMNFFQSGHFDGWVELQGRRHTVTARAGFRDRGWGVRKHEGAPRRGLVLSAFCELPEESLYLIIFETASGRRVLMNGWRIDSSGVDPAVAIDHDLVFEEHLLREGQLHAEFASGSRRQLQLTARQRLFLVGVGYSPETRYTAPGVETFDVSDARVRAELQGQTDHGCDFEVDGVVGHGYVETGLGIHQRYRPE